MFRNGKFLLFVIVLLTNLAAGAQDLEPTDIGRKKVSDMILRHRSLVVPDPFDAKRTLLRLFPGKWYDQSKSKYQNQLISWICPTCTPKIYPDANQMDTLRFPYPDGVATRLLDVFSFSDSSGKQYKVMSFNHSEYDADGIIGAYGAFSQAPKPQPLLIGNGQYAFLIDHVNGGPGGPFWQDTYLIALMEGSFQQLLVAYSTGRTAGNEGKSSWTCSYSLSQGKGRRFGIS